VRLFAAVRFGDSATCAVLPEISVFALQTDGRAVTKLVLDYQGLDVRVSFLIFTSFNEKASVLRIQLAVFFQAGRMRGFASRKYDLPAGAGTRAFSVKRLRAQFPRNNMHCRSGHGNCTKHFCTPWLRDFKTQLKGLCNAFVNTAE